MIFADDIVICSESRQQLEEPREVEVRTRDERNEGQS